MRGAIRVPPARGVGGCRVIPRPSLRSSVGGYLHTCASGTPPPCSLVGGMWCDAVCILCVMCHVMYVERGVRCVEGLEGCMQCVEGGVEVFVGSGENPGGVRV